MYNFIDVTEASEGVVLPSEAMKINGQYIEDQISGYRTLNVSGREALSPDVVEFDVGNRDGSNIQYKRYPSRIIVVTYQLIAESNEAFREAYNQLGKILNVQDAELIFADEQDKFFVGTPCIIDTVDPGRNAVVGKFEILCNDPFKYSVTEYEATTDLDDPSILINYNGTYPAKPKLEAEFWNEEDVAADGSAATLTGAGDCGFVAFFDENKNIVQLGDPDEVDGVNAYAKSQTQMNQTFLSETAWAGTAQQLWAMNTGVLPPGVTASQMGTVNMGVAGTASYTTIKAGETSQTLVSNLKASGAMYYTVRVTTTKRTPNSVNVALSVTVTNKTNKAIDSNTPITAYIDIAGRAITVTAKAASVTLAQGKSRTGSTSATFTGLTAEQTSLQGVKFRAYSPNLTDAWTNSTALPNVLITAYSSTSGTYATGHYLFPNSHGDASGWHGPSITRTFGADASGVVGAKDFTLTYSQKMCIGSGSGAANQLGGFHCHLSDASGKVVVGVRISKNQSGIGQASLMLFVNNTKVHQVGIDLSYNNKMFGNYNKAVHTTTIIKTGNKVVFNIAGYAYTYTNNSIADLAATKCTFMFERYGTSPILTHNGLYTAKFVKNNCNTYKDIPNKFSANDVVLADCSDAEIYLNNQKRPDLGAIGNHWEAFELKPGLNQIGVAWSEWVAKEYAPTFRVKYREVFL